MIYAPRRPKSQKPLFGTVEVNWGHPLARGLVACWLFNEGGGGVVRDLCGPFSGTVQGGAVWTPSIKGPALSMDGTDDYVSVGNDPRLLPSAGSVLVNFQWSGTPTTYDGIIANTFNASWSDGWGLYWANSGFVNFWATALYTDYAQIALDPAQPHSIVGTWAGSGIGSINIYGDGVLGTPNPTYTGLSLGTTGVLEIGRLRDNSYNLSGAVSQALVWNVVLNQNDAAWLTAEPYAFLRPKIVRTYSWPVRIGAGGGTPHLVPIGQVTETDLAQPIARLKSKTLGQVSETDLAQPITRGFVTKLIPVGQVTETDLAQAITRRKSKTLGQLLETDVAQTFSTPRKSRALGQPAEVDLAQAFSRIKMHSFGLTTETDVAQTVGKAKRIAIGQAVEVDQALHMTVHGGAAGGGGTGTGGAGILRVIRG